MSSKPRTLDELEREIDAAEEADLAAPAPAFSTEQLERYDRIFSKSQAKAVRECMQRLARHRGSISARLVQVYWKSIVAAAHRYKQHREERRIPMKKQRLDREVRRLAVTYGADSLAVRIVAGGDDRGRPDEGRYEYIAALCKIYSKLTGRRPTVTWQHTRWRGEALDLLRACLAPEIFFEKGRPLKDNAIAVAVKRIAESARVARAR